MNNKYICNLKPTTPEYYLFLRLYDQWKESSEIVTYQEIFDNYLAKTRKKERAYNLTPKAHCQKYKGKIPENIKRLIKSSCDTQGRRGYRIKVEKGRKR